MAVTIPEPSVGVEALALTLALEPTDDRVARAWGEAVDLLSTALAGAFRDVPQDTVDRLHLEVAADLFKRGDAPANAGQYADPDGRTSGANRRPSADPLARARSTLAQFVVPF